MDGKRSYKKFLESGDIEDVPPDTLRRARRKWRKAANVLQESKSDLRKTDDACLESTKSSDLEQGEAVESMNTESFSASAEHEGAVDDNVVTSINDESTQWEIPVDDDSNNSTSTDIDENEIDNPQNNLLNITDFNSFINNTNIFKTITTCANKSPGEIFWMLLKFTVCNQLSLRCTSSLFRLVNSIFKEPVLPESEYMLDKLLHQKKNIEYHGICPQCQKYVGKIDTFKVSVECDVCSFSIKLSNPSLENIFLILDPSEDIENLIDQHSSYYDYVVNERKYDGTIKDIYDGQCYRSFVNNLPEAERTSYVTAILNIDGAPKFEYSNYSIWPIYLLINEIPVPDRLKSSIVCGMWFGKQKPPMDTFLKPLIEKLNKLSSEGIECKIKNETRVLKLHVLVICVDSVARAPMQGHKQFNGYYGCTWCLHPGEYFQGSMRYPIPISYPQLRTQEQTVRFMQIVTANRNMQDLYGVQSVSPLINLKGFDIINGYVPDYMHCYVAGVGKQITECIVQTVPDKVPLMDKFLKNIKVPQQLARCSKSISERDDWKAKEWENFILHFSIPLYTYLLEDKLVKYWTLFVDSLYILLKDNITMEELDNADRMLHEFNVSTEEIFTKKAMTFNVHQLLHITTSVLNWGPLWSHSAFPFESANYKVLQMIHCAKGVNLQIVRHLNYEKCLKFLENHIYPHASPKVIKFCEDISNKRIQKSYKKNNITYLGSASIVNPLMLYNLNLSKNCKVFTRAVINGCLYAAENKRCTRSNNSYCQLVNGTFTKILYFVIDDDSGRDVILSKQIRTVNKITNSIFSFDSIVNEITVINVEHIKTICVPLCVGNVFYISVLPNLFHY